MTQSNLSFQAGTETQDVAVKMAIRAFVQALAESPEYQAFEQASERLRLDETAQNAIVAFQEKQQSLQMFIRLNAVSPQDQAELEYLQEEFLRQTSVSEYFQAQQEFSVLCQLASNQLSEQIGLSFAAACGPGCC